MPQPPDVADLYAAALESALSTPIHHDLDTGEIVYDLVSTTEDAEAVLEHLREQYGNTLELASPVSSSGDTLRGLRLVIANRLHDDASSVELTTAEWLAKLFPTCQLYDIESGATITGEPRTMTRQGFSDLLKTSRVMGSPVDD